LSWRNVQAGIQNGEAAPKKFLSTLGTFMQVKIVLTSMKKVVANYANHAQQKLDVSLIFDIDRRLPRYLASHNNLPVWRTISQELTSLGEGFGRFGIECVAQRNGKGVPIRLSFRRLARLARMLLEDSTRLQRVLEPCELQKESEQQFSVDRQGIIKAHNELAHWRQGTGAVA